MAATLASFTIGANAATVLYSENFDGEGTAVDAYNDGTTPEINLNGTPTLQATGISQGGNVGDSAWRLNGPGVGEKGLRFGGSDNWALGSNSATILLAGGFSISFDYTLATDSNWMGVRVGSGGENSAINAGDTTFGALARGDGRMETHDNGVASPSFGTAGANVTRSAQFNYAFTSWNAGTTVTFTGIIDGNTIATDTFTWDASNDMKIIFTGIETGSTMDNIVVSTIPEPSAALLGGLGLLALLRRRR